MESPIKTNKILSNHFRLSTKTLVLSALFVAVSAILGNFSFLIAGGTIKIGFGRIPVVLAGLLLGPLAGGLTGAVSDIVGMLLRPTGGFHPGFTFSAFVSGCIPGLVVLLSRKKKFSLFNIILSVVLVYIIVTLVLNTIWISQIIGKSFIVLLPARATGQAATNIVNIIIIYMLSKSIKQLNI